MLKRTLFSIALVALLLGGLAQPAAAWNATGHKVVAYIAWQHMTPEARAEAVRLLRHTSLRSGLHALAAESTGGTYAERLFLEASVWSDVVRDRDHQERYRRYHRGPWHYTGYYWDEEGPEGAPRTRQDMGPAPQNVVERLDFMEAAVVSEVYPTAQEGIFLAWLLHLVGDLHQPLAADGDGLALECRRIRLDVVDGDSLHANGPHTGASCTLAHRKPAVARRCSSPTPRAPPAAPPDWRATPSRTRPPSCSTSMARAARPGPPPPRRGWPAPPRRSPRRRARRPG